MTPAIYNFKNQYQGDTFLGLAFVLKNNDVVIDLTDADVLLQFKKKGCSDVYESLEIGSGLTFISAVGGSFQIDDFLMDWDVCIYNYDLSVTFPDGTITTYLKGTFEVERQL